MWASERKLRLLEESAVNLLESSYRGMMDSPWQMLLNWYEGEGVERGFLRGDLGDLCSFFTKEEFFGDPTKFSPVVKEEELESEVSYTITQYDGSDVKINRGDFLASGSYGSIYSANLQQSSDVDQPIVLKIVEVEEVEESFKLSFLKTRSRVKDLIYGFSHIMNGLTNDAVKEAWVGALLYCINRKYGKRDVDLLLVDGNAVNVHARLPKIFVSATFKDILGEEKVLIAMDKMDITLKSFIKNPHDYPVGQVHAAIPDTLNAFKMYIFGIACTLNVLQTQLKFVHGDFHSGNAMLVENAQGLVYPCIIDFGFTCVNLFNKRYAFDEEIDQNTDFNSSRDLLNLIWSIDAFCNKNIGTESNQGPHYTKYGEEIREWCEQQLINAGIPEKFDYRNEQLIDKYHTYLRKFATTEKNRKLVITTNDISKCVVNAFNPFVTKHSFTFGSLYHIKRDLDPESTGKVPYDKFQEYMDQYIPKPYWKTYHMTEEFNYFNPKTFAIHIAQELGLSIGAFANS